MKYFKTDGIRQKANELIFSLIPLKLGRILGDKSKRIVIGYDTRESSVEIYNLLVTGIITRGCDVISLGVCPSSMVGYITKKENCDYGIMITASHNPYYDNGIKVFSKIGEKINKVEELEIEELLDKDIEFPYSKNLGRLDDTNGHLFEYINYLKSNIINTNEKILIDCSNGVMSKIIPLVFDGIIDYTLINSNPNGRNINYDCGSEHLESLLSNINKDYTLGVSFDGDGDRVIIYRNNKIYSGDDLLYLFVNEDNYIDVVTTKMSNLGLIETLEKENKKVYYSDVGDNNVYSLMKEKNVLLGGESSGHIMFLHSKLINDGLFTLIKFMNLKNKDVEFSKYYSKTININLDNKDYSALEISNLEKEINSSLSNRDRVFIRKSGTENLLRINIQTKEENDLLEVEKLFIKG